MNLVVMRLTWRALVGKKRALILVGLPILLFGIAILTRLNHEASPFSSATMTYQYTLGTILPLTCLLIATGVIAPEIEDGSIVYLLAKPIPRRTIAFSKLAVAYVAGFAFAVVPAIAAIEIAGDRSGEFGTAYGIAAALATIAYTTVFFAISTLSRNPVIVGLLYAILWETTLGGYAPGVQTVSIRQWALAPADAYFDRFGGGGWDVGSAVSLTTGVIMLILVTVGAAYVSVRRLKTLRLRTSE